jgi:tRNA 2-thiouridine synthesizing protein A
MADGSSSEVLDLRGLKCPLPALFARRALMRATEGTMLIVIADDPLAAVDIPHMCHQERFDVLSLAQRGAESRITIRKPSSSSH